MLSCSGGGIRPDAITASNDRIATATSPALAAATPRIRR
jgi:hypothetical protein